MNKAQHGAKLRAAMAEQGYSRDTIADVTDVGVRTVTNWTTGKTMPSDTERAKLRRLLGTYDDPGDPVEAAIRRSELVEWRQDTVVGFYKRNLSEQREDEGRRTG